MHTRREFLKQTGVLGIVTAAVPWGLAQTSSAQTATLPDVAVGYPGPWQFQRPRGSIILVSDQQLVDLQDPDKEVDLSLSDKPNLTTLRRICEQTRARGGRTIVLAFDEFWSQYRRGQGGKPRQLLPDTAEYIRLTAGISKTLKEYGLGLELSLLSPLELGRGYAAKTGEKGRWVQYREGYRDPQTGHYSVNLWEQRFWTNNKGTIGLERTGVRVFAFREQRVGTSDQFVVDPGWIKELKEPPQIESGQAEQGSTRARLMTVRGSGETGVGGLNRVLVVVSYDTPEMDYFSPRALPFLRELVDHYHTAGVPLNGLYADEMHIQQDWGYHSHHDEGQFTFRYLTAHFQKTFAALYGAEFEDFEKYLVYFGYGQHGFLPGVEARLSAQHVMGGDPDAVHRTFLLRRRYYDLLEQHVVKLFADAKHYAEEKYGHELEARAHATWAQSPTCDSRSGALPVAPRQYEYTDDFLWSNTVQQAAAACSDYFAWNDFLTGGGNDHAEGGWSDRDYYGIALGCSTGILNRVPYAYAAAWGLPAEAGRRRQAVCDAFGASANQWFQAVQDSQHRDIEVLMIYPMSLVACEERFGSWMTQYGYANYVTARKLVQHGRVQGNRIEMAGRTFNTVAVLFEPLPPADLLALLERFAEAGGKVVWSGPPPRLTFEGTPALERWQRLFGIASLGYQHEGHSLPGRAIRFENVLETVPEQTILTGFLVDQVYPVTPQEASGARVVARVPDRIVGTHRSLGSGGSATFLGFRPRDDQSAALGYETRTWFEVLRALGAYPGVGDAAAHDNPTVISRTTPYVSCRFPNGTITLAAHYRTHEERWPGGFHRDAKADQEILTRHPLPSDRLEFRNFAVAGHQVTYDGALTVAFRLGASGLLAFAGHQCRGIEVDGRKYEFCANPFHALGWAPVLPERRVSGGAVLEIWAHGQGGLTVPLSEPWTAGKVYLEGGRLGSLGQEIPATIESGRLTFEVQPNWPRHHLFFVPA